MKRQIVVLGAGFGGLRAAKILGKKVGKEHGVTLIDRNAYHTFTPLLYEVASTDKETANYIDLKSLVTYPISTLLESLPITFIQSGISGIDLENSLVDLEDGKRVVYDYLVIALGAEVYHFEIPGLVDAAFAFKTFTDALKLRDAIWERIRGKVAEDIRIVIGGAGATGVELAGELAEWLCRVSKQRGKECHAAISLVEAAPTILSGFDARVIEKVKKRLQGLGVTILTSRVIEKVIDHRVQFQGGVSVPFDILIWTGGTRANRLAGALPIKTERRGHARVAPSLFCIPQTPDLKLGGRVYGIGDVTCFYDQKTNKPIPGVARAAISEASTAARNIIRDLRGQKPLIYTAKDYPYIIPVGGKYAVAKVGPLVFSGFFAWVFKGLVELNYLASVMPNMRAVKIWLRGLKTFVKNDRLG